MPKSIITGNLYFLVFQFFSKAVADMGQPLLRARGLATLRGQRCQRGLEVDALATQSARACGGARERVRCRVAGAAGRERRVARGARRAAGAARRAREASAVLVVVVASRGRRGALVSSWAESPENVGV